MVIDVAEGVQNLTLRSMGNFLCSPQSLIGGGGGRGHTVFVMSVCWFVCLFVGLYVAKNLKPCL